MGPMAPWAPWGPMGGPWGPMGLGPTGPMGPMGPMGPHGPYGPHGPMGPDFTHLLSSRLGDRSVVPPVAAQGQVVAVVNSVAVGMGGGLVWGGLRRGGCPHRD